jgi:hypothetical protein
MIKYYSAVVLVLTVTYHLIRFQFYDLDDFFDQLRSEKNFFVVNLKFLGFAETESDTRHSVQLYTAYMIVGQFLHKYFNDKLQLQEGRELFNWTNAFKTK